MCGLSNLRRRFVKGSTSRHRCRILVFGTNRCRGDGMSGGLIFVLASKGCAVGASERALQGRGFEPMEMRMD